MANSKISALTASTTPLAGTEVLPIVQSSTTKQVSVANLTAGRAISASSLTLSTGSLTQGTASTGYDFTANTPKAGMTSQLLNWYEEGTWTPTATSGSGAITTYASAGTYTRVGRQVTVTAYVDLTNVGTAGGNLIITNFPYKNGAASGSGFLQQMGVVRETGVTGVIYAVFLLGNSTSGYISSMAGGAILWINSYQYALSITYYTA
jgi:hypothetical protein